MNTREAISGMLLAALCASSSAQAPAVSTAADRGESPLMLDISKDSRMSRVGLDYAVKWDFSDLASFAPGLGMIYSGLKSITSWDITENTRLEYYGLKANPWRLIITKEKLPVSSGAASAAGPSQVVRQDANGYRKRFHFSFSPLVDDLKRNFDENLSNFLLRNSLKGASPEWEKLGQQNRKTVIRDMLALPVWEAPVPGVSQTKDGLEYLGR